LGLKNYCCCYSHCCNGDRILLVNGPVKNWHSVLCMEYASTGKGRFWLRM
jgi:hypothetical protein